MTDTRPRLTPGADHPITMRPHDDRAVARVGSLVIADTDRAIELREASYPPVLYFPLADVDQRLLQSSTEHTYCPYKGDASYYDVTVTDGEDLPAAVWYYADPYPAVSAIRDHVAFYPDRVTIAAS